MKMVFLAPSGALRSLAAFRVGALCAAGRARGLDVSLLEVPRSPFARYAFFSRLPRADVYLVHRELLSGYELRALRRLCSRLVYDFMDASWTLPDSGKSSATGRRRAARAAHRFAQMCASADLCLVESMVQAQAAIPHQPQVRLLPTPVDTEVYRPAAQQGAGGAVRVGWLVTGGDRQCLADIVGGLADHAGPIQFSIVSDSPYDGPCRDFVFWAQSEPSREVERLRAMDIGLAPYPDDEYFRATSGLDILRYMACGVAVVASDRGGASEIIDHGIDGFFARDVEDWTRHVLNLAGNVDLRRRMSEAGRRKIVAKFGLAEISDQLWELLGISGPNVPE
jgi:hypothetical protein